MNFKGIWIPTELLEFDISWTKRILIAEISQLEMLDKGCIASNGHFAEKLKLTKQAVSKSLNELARDNYITIDNSQSKRNFGRIITINFSKSGVHESKSAINFSKSGVHESVETIENIQFNKTKNKTIKTLTSLTEQINTKLSEYENINLNAFNEWMQYKNYKAIVPVIKVLNFLSNYDLDAQQKIVDASIMNNYKGLFEPKQNTKQQPKSFKQQDREQSKNEIDAYLNSGYSLRDDLDSSSTQEVINYEH